MKPELYEFVGDRIRELRKKFNGGEGLSQEALAAGVKVATNTVSRWETAVYQPSLADLDNLSRFFGVPLSHFIPNASVAADEKLNALLRAAKDLPPGDVEELRRFAEFRRASISYPQGKPSLGRKRRKAT